jgi:hypothetical protein
MANNQHGKIKKPDSVAVIKKNASSINLPSPKIVPIFTVMTGGNIGIKPQANWITRGN